MNRRPALLEWDSNFFDKRIGKLVMKRGERPADYEKFDLLYVVSNEDSIPDIQGFLCSYQEIRVIFVNREWSSKTTDQSRVISVFKTSYKPADLYALAFESGHRSRFRRDPNFSDAEFKALFTAWIDNSFTQNFAHDVLVCIYQGKLAGFATYRLAEEYAVIGLIAVDSKLQGKGLGSMLIHAIEHELSKLKVTELRIPTQFDNESAIRFYKKMGYSEMERTFVKHYWNDDTFQ